jgi:hypothetical protein
MVTLASKYQIALYASGIGALSPVKTVLTTTQADPFPAPHQTFSEVVGNDLNNAPIKAGFARATWHWDWIYRSDYPILEALVGNVYIETKDEGGAWHQYLCLCSIPKEPEPMSMGRCGAVDLELSMLVLQT